MTLTTLLAMLVLIVGVPLNLYVTFRLLRLSRAAPDVALIRDRAISSLGTLILVTVFGIIFLNNDAPEPFLAFNDTKLYTRLAMFLVAVIPAMYWLVATRKAHE